MANQPIVFISYSRDDISIAHQITEVLERGGHRPWIDNQLVPGQRWREKIEQAINKANAFLILLSPAAIASQYCQWEYALAIEKQKPIFPVIIKPLSSDLPETMSDLANIQHVDMSEGINAANAASLIGGVFQATPLTQTKVPLSPKAPSKPPVNIGSDALPTDPGGFQMYAAEGTEPLTRLPLPNQNVLPRGIKASLELVQSPKLDGRTLPIHITNYTIGRAPKMDLTLPENRISKHHLTIYWANSRFFIVDYSLNGTWLNGERIQNNRPMRLDADFEHRLDLARNNTVLNFSYSVVED